MIAFLPPRSFIVVLLLTHVPALGGALDDDRVVEGTSSAGDCGVLFLKWS